MSLPEYSKYDGIALGEMVRRKEVTALELVESAIDRIERHNPKLNAVVHKGYDDARKAAKGPLPDGPFAGVPFLIKDLYCDVAGWPQTNGSRMYDGYVSKEDSELTRRFKASGVVLVGKTNTPEFGITGTTESARLGPCRSPWNTEHISGGSSGGSASAVGAGIVPMAHASDGLGSIRIPAACCGLVGLKVTRDRTPRDANTPQTGLSVNNIVSRTVRDSAAMLDAIGYPEKHAPFASPTKTRPYMDEIKTPPGKLRIAFYSDPPSNTPLHPDVAKALVATAKMLESLGHHVEEKKINVDWRALYKAQGAHSAGHFGAGIRLAIETMGREPKAGDFERLTQAYWEGSRTLTADRSAWGTMKLGELTREILAHWDTIDVYLCPTMIAPPPKVGFIDTNGLEPKELNRRQASVFGFTPPYNMTGQPSISLPLAQSSDGLPIGMMFTGRYSDEATLFRLAAQLEQAMPWKDRRPAIWN